MKKRQVLFVILMIILCFSTSCGLKNTEEETSFRRTEVIADSRDMTSAEAFAMQVSLPTLYLYEGKQAEQEYPGIQEGQYPEEALTEDQILWLIEQKYKDISEEQYMPKGGQITYEEAKKYVPIILKDYVTDCEMDTCYLYYGYAAFAGEVTDCWLAMIHMQDGDKDYSVYIDAEDGQLMQWSSRTKDFYTAEGFTAENRSVESESAIRTDVELVTFCENFLQDTAFRDVERKFENVKLLSNEDTQRVAQLELPLEDGRTLVFYVNKGDLTMDQVMVR